jgi:hypothetical protein
MAGDGMSESIITILAAPWGYKAAVIIFGALLVMWLLSSVHDDAIRRMTDEELEDTILFNHMNLEDVQPYEDEVRRRQLGEPPRVSTLSSRPWSITAIILLLALGGIMLVTPARAEGSHELCHATASMYRMVFGLRDLDLSDDQLMVYAGISNQFSEDARQRAVWRTRRGGDLGNLTASTIYNHVFHECRGIR